MKYSDYSEKKQRGKPDFPIQLYEVDSNHLEYVMPLHWHREWEIIKIYEGTFCLYLDTDELVLHQGDVVFVNSRVLHRGIPHDCRYACVVFNPELLIPKYSALFDRFFAPLIDGNRRIEPILRQEESPLYRETEAVFHLLKDEKPYYELYTIQTLFTLFRELTEQGRIVDKKAVLPHVQRGQEIADLIRYIDENHSEPLTLASLSQVAGITPNYLCHLFKSYTGKTPFEYLNSIRLENVCFALQSENKSITAIATEHGFNDISYFCKVFKNQIGMTANAYRRQFVKSTKE